MTARKLSLSKETLADMTTDELRDVAAAGSWTARPNCIVSIEPCLTIAACTVLCFETS